MGLETGDHISDLVDTNPLGTDPVSEGDDHLRLVKRCLQGNTAGDVATTELLANALTVLLATALGIEITPNAAGPVSVVLPDDGGGDQAELKADGAGLLSLIDSVLAGVLELRGSVAGAGDTLLASFDPAGAVQLFHAGEALSNVETINSGLVLRRASGNSPLLRFEDATQETGQIQANSTGPMDIRSAIETRGIRLQGTQTGGATVSVLESFPESFVDLFFAGVRVFRTLVDGIEVTGNVTWKQGSGSPEGVVSANPGSIYSDNVSGSAAPLWMKNFSGGNTGWLQVAFVP